MNETIKIAIIALIAAFVGGFVAGLVGGNQPSFGGVTNYDTLEATSLAVGSGCDNEGSACTGSAVTQLLKGTCNLLGMNSSQAATSSAVYDCAVTGVVSGDVVFAQLSTTTQATLVTNWAIMSAKASSTSGFITVRVLNLSGAAVVPSISAVGSSTGYLILR